MEILVIIVEAIYGSNLSLKIEAFHEIREEGRSE
jgi:hypothetical protein